MPVEFLAYIFSQKTGKANKSLLVEFILGLYLLQKLKIGSFNYFFIRYTPL
jgi:hypothetical protein